MYALNSALQDYLIQCFNNAEDAIAEIKDGLKYHLLIVDISISWKRWESGFDVIEFSHKKNPKVPIIGVSLSPETYTSNAPRYDNLRYMSKRAIIPDSAREIIKELLGKK